MPRLDSPPRRKPVSVPSADALNAGGAGVWLGWRHDHGWVFLDRTLRFNQPSGTEYFFVRASDWGIYREDPLVWKNDGTYLFYARRLGLADGGAAERMRADVESLCAAYVERAPTLRREMTEAFAEKTRALERAAAAAAEKARREAEERRIRIEEDEARRRSALVGDLTSEMLSRQKADSAKIRRFVQGRNIRYLMHFTRVENLAGIIERGIVPRADLPAGFNPNDQLRLDGFPEASCLSASYLNYRMFWHYRNQDPGANWAIVHLSPETLTSQPCLFYPTNAANGRFRDEGRSALSARMGLGGLASMFEDVPPGLRDRLGLKPRWTTDPQAEILAFGPIPTERFDAIALLNPEPAVEKMVLARLPGVRFGVAGELFEKRPDFRHWQTQPSRPAAPSARCDDDLDLIPF